MHRKQSFFYCALFAVAAGGQIVAVAAVEPLSVRLAETPPNRWVKVDEVESGGRNSPMLFYDAHREGVFLVGGTPGGNYGNAKRHFEVEFFDPKSGAWSNLYPPNAPWKNLAGVTDAPAMGNQAKPLREANGIVRLGMFPDAYGTDSRAHFQWAYAPDQRRLYAYLFNKTIFYDTAARTWQDSGAAPFSKGGFPMVWGNMGYDPVNREILSIGGSSAELGGTPGTWVFSTTTTNGWRKLEPGSAELKRIHESAMKLRREAWALLSACRARYFVAESEAEAKQSLSSRAVQLEPNLQGLSTAIAGAGLRGHEVPAGVRAMACLTEANAQLKAVAPKLDGAMTPDLIAEVKSAHDAMELVELALAPEPPGRAHAQMAYDAKHGKIVLFGGSGLDRCYADTWLYDPKTRAWEQRWPEVSPAPRAGHALVFLPRSGRIALAGGYGISGGFRELPHQVWTYDTAVNTWKPLLSLPLARQQRGSGPSADTPRGGRGGNYAGGGSPWAAAALPDDTLIMIDTFTASRVTWGCKIDPAAPAADTAELPGVPPGTMTFAVSPERWERDQPAPNPEEVRQIVASLKPNVWTALKPPKGVDHRAWNTTAYDPDRQQLLWWGGGHVTYMGTDVAHYSMRANRWTLGYPPDLPTEPTGGFYVKAALSFQDRPQIPVHAYQAYAYDPPSGKMFYLSRAYDVAARQWDREPYPGLQSGGSMGTLLETTPQGVVALSQHGLFRFNAGTKAWEKLPWEGPAFGKAWCDGHALCYDAKRDGLWMANEEIFFYDLKSGRVEKREATRPQRLGKWALWREQIHLPDADLILLMRRFNAEKNVTGKFDSGTDAHVAFDPASGKYYEVPLDFEGGMPRELSWSGALHYDSRLKMAILHDGWSNVWVMKFDRATARMKEL